ncbi:MAG: hypothetical protein U0T77_12315 [Chitinophagales bacterium]
MDKYLEKITEIFDTYEKWKSFQKLKSYEINIKNYFIEKAIGKINSIVKEKEYIKKGWTFSRDNSSSIAFVCYPERIKNREISFWFENNKFSLWIDISKFDKEGMQKKLFLHKDQFEFLFKGNFTSYLHKPDSLYKIEEVGYFYFDNPNDYCYDFESLVWFMGNKSEEFANQLLEKFTAVMTPDIEQIILQLYDEFYLGT